MAPLKVLVSGGGITGNALAFWLSKLGHDVTVVERFPSLRATGLQIDLRGHGIEVMKRMGLEDAFRSKSVDEQGVQMVDYSGKQRAFFPANKSGEGLQSFTSDYEIMRGDLCHLIYDAAKNRAKYIFGTSIESFEETNSSVEVRFTDGKTDRFDLVIGADGQGSHTRKMMRGSETANGFHPLGGDTIAYFTIPRPIQEGERYIATAYIAPGKRAIMTRRHNPHKVQAYLMCTADPERQKTIHKGNVQQEKEAFAEIFQGAGWQTEELLNSMNNSDDFYCERIGIVKLDSWSRGRVALVGDAAYCPSANTAMGTTSSLVGAYVFAGAIGRHCRRSNEEGINRSDDTQDGVATALEAYERTFRPFMDQVQRGISTENKSRWDMVPSTSFTIAILTYLVGIVSFLRLHVIFEWLFREDIKGWDLPEYEEILRG